MHMNIYETGKKETVTRCRNGCTLIAGRNINRNIPGGEHAVIPAVDTGELFQHGNSSFDLIFLSME
jgi:hypothetical protein